jgi:hypothetical protein
VPLARSTAEHEASTKPVISKQLCETCRVDSTLAAIQRPGADSFSCADDQVEGGGEFSNSTSRFIAFGRDRLGNLRWAFGSGDPYFYRESPLRPAFVERPRTPECRGEAVFLQEGRRPNAGYSPPCESMTRAASP